VPVEAIRGDVENTGNDKLAKQVIVPCERTIPKPARFSLLHHGQGQMIDHLLVSRSLLAHYRGSEIHNELLHDESVAFRTEVKFPEVEIRHDPGAIGEFHETIFYCVARLALQCPHTTPPIRTGCPPNVSVVAMASSKGWLAVSSSASVSCRM
jgi:hypothetical protein